MSRSYDYSVRNTSGGNRSQSQLMFSAPAPSSTSVPSSKNMYDLKGRAPGSKYLGKFSGTKTYPTFPNSDKNHSIKCLAE